jgi:hypothetical protein
MLHNSKLERLARDKHFSLFGPMKKIKCCEYIPWFQNNFWHYLWQHNRNEMNDRSIDRKAGQKSASPMGKLTALACHPTKKVEKALLLG